MSLVDNSIFNLLSKYIVVLPQKLFFKILLKNMLNQSIRPAYKHQDDACKFRPYSGNYLSILNNDV